MASWMIHLRIADALLDRLGTLDETAFVMGNLAPDSGVPNEDRTGFIPPKSVTHYHRERNGRKHAVAVDEFCSDHFSPEQTAHYSLKEYSFFLGYYIHLMCDIAWNEKIYVPSLAGFTGSREEDKNAYISRLKEDWYDLDFRYLNEHPGFRGFRIYEEAKEFGNEFMKEFSEDAFDNRRAYICAFYHGSHGELYREYPFLSPERADAFVTETVENVCRFLSDTGRIKDGTVNCSFAADSGK